MSDFGALPVVKVKILIRHYNGSFTQSFKRKSTNKEVVLTLQPGKTPGEYRGPKAKGFINSYIYLVIKKKLKLHQLQNTVFFTVRTQAGKDIIAIHNRIWK
jgi:hypothetical protein